MKFVKLRYSMELQPLTGLHQISGGVNDLRMVRKYRSAKPWIVFLSMLFVGPLVFAQGLVEPPAENPGSSPPECVDVVRVEGRPSAGNLIFEGEIQPICHLVDFPAAVEPNAEEVGQQGSNYHPDEAGDKGWNHWAPCISFVVGLLIGSVGYSLIRDLW